MRAKRLLFPATLFVMTSVVPATAQKTWSAADLMIGVCPTSGWARIAVEGFIRQAGIPRDDDGNWRYTLVDAPGEDDFLCPFILSRRRLEVRDGMRARITGPCQHGEFFPHVWVELYEPR